MNDGAIMIVDDEQPIRVALQGLFEDEGYLVATAASGEEALAKLRKGEWACVLLDIWMPGIDGLETLARIRRLDPTLPVIMMSGHATIDTAVKATKQGAYDFLEKPLSSERVLILVRNAIERRRLQQRNAALRTREEAREEELVGEHPEVREARRRIAQVAASRDPVLLLGEHGAGKTTAARMLHLRSGRERDAWVRLPASSIPSGRFMEEMFGGGGGADEEAAPGKLALARNGSLYLDEIGELDREAQGLLLQLLQQRLRRPDGGEARHNVRFIAGSALSLAELRERLRADLFDRLSRVVIALPPVRRRSEDVPRLIEHLARRVAAEFGAREPVRFDAGAMEALKAYRWPGNLHEMRNYVERCHILHFHEMEPEGFTRESMPPVVVGGEGGAGGAAVGEGLNFAAARERFEADFIRRHLEMHDWNISRTAVAIGVERSQLHRKMRALGIAREGGRR